MKYAKQADRLEGLMDTHGIIDIKGKQTRIHIPDCVSGDTREITAQALFSDETETRQEDMIKPKVPKITPACRTKPLSLKKESLQQRLPSCKRKLTLECASLSGRETPKRCTPNFKNLQSFWKNKIEGSGSDSNITGGKTTEEISVKEVGRSSTCDSQTGVDIASQSPMDKVSFSYIERFSKVNSSSLDLTKGYSDAVSNSSDNVLVDKKLSGEDRDSSELPAVVGELGESCVEQETPDMKLQSLPRFRSMNNVKLRNVSEQSDTNESNSSFNLSSLTKSDRKTSTSRKDRFANEAFSPDDLILPKDWILRRTKSQSKRRLLSLDPGFYSPLSNSLDGEDSGAEVGTSLSGSAAVCQEAKVKDDTSVDVTVGLDDTSIWSEESGICEDSVPRILPSDRDFSLSLANISPILPIKAGLHREKYTAARVLELSANDESCSELDASIQTDVELLHVINAIHRKISSFMGSDSDASVKMSEIYQMIDNLEESTSFKKIMQPEVTSPKTLLSMAGESLGPTRSELYSVLMKKAEGQVLNNFSDPVSVQIPARKEVGGLEHSIHEDDGILFVTLESETEGDALEGSLYTPVLRAFDPCWSPVLRCPVSPLVFSTDNQRLLWSPTFNDLESSAPSTGCCEQM